MFGKTSLNLCLQLYHLLKPQLVAVRAKAFAFSEVFAVLRP